MLDDHRLVESCGPLISEGQCLGLIGPQRDVAVAEPGRADVRAGGGLHGVQPHRLREFGHSGGPSVVVALEESRHQSVVE